MRRFRGSGRCSLRVIPGGSARSETAARTLSTRSAMVGGLAGCYLGYFGGMRLGLGDLGDGVEHGSERGVADGKAGGGWHEIEIAGGGDGQRLGRRLSRRRFNGRRFAGRRFGLGLLVRVAYEKLFSGGRRDGVLGSVGDRRCDWSGGLHRGDFLSLLLLVGDAELFFHLPAELVG